MSLSEWLMKLLKFWNWDSLTCNQITALCAISWVFLKDLIIFMFNKIKSFMLFMFNKIKSFMLFIFNWIREKIIGKENLELLKELKILKSNERAIEFLGLLSSEDEGSKVNGYYEALLSFMCLYSNEMIFNEFKEAYKKDEEDRIRYGAGFNIYKLRETVLKELIKKYSK